MPNNRLNHPMPLIAPEPEPDEGCAFILDGDASVTPERTRCGAPRRPGSAYCDAHHALCHLPSDSPAGRRKLDEIAALAKAVGGRSGNPARSPPLRFLRRMDRISRAALQPKCSCFVLKKRQDHGADR